MTNKNGTFINKVTQQVEIIPEGKVYAFKKTLYYFRTDEELWDEGLKAYTSDFRLDVNIEGEGVGIYNSSSDSFDIHEDTGVEFGDDILVNLLLLDERGLIDDLTDEAMEEWGEDYEA